MHSHCGIARCDSRPSRQIVQTPVLEIDQLQCFLVLRFKCFHKGLDALADLIFEKGIRSFRENDLLAPTLIGSLSRITSSVVVNGGIAQDSVEPGNGALLIAELGSMLKTPDKRGLQDVFSNLPGLHALLKKAQELPVAVHQLL